MAIIIKRQSALPKAVARNRGHTKARAPIISLDHPGRIRVANWLALLNIGHSAFYSRRAVGAIPNPDGNDPRPYWRTETVRDFLTRKEGQIK